MFIRPPGIPHHTPARATTRKKLCSSFPRQREPCGFRRDPRSRAVRTVSTEPDSFAGGAMIRRAAAVVLALALNPALVRAQDTVFTVSVPSADVYKGPSTGTPVVGHVSRGTVLPISRNLGSWIKIAWPQAPDGVAYVHVTMGHIGPAGANTPAMRSPQSTPSSTAAAAPPPASAPKPVSTTGVPAARASVSQPAATRRRLNVTPAEHTFGVGGLLGTMRTWGASARTWVNPHVGVQVGFTR